MKTPEEILREKTRMIFTHQDLSAYKDMLISAMEEYADQTPSNPALPSENAIIKPGFSKEQTQWLFDYALGYGNGNPAITVTRESLDQIFFDAQKKYESFLAEGGMRNENT